MAKPPVPAARPHLARSFGITFLAALSSIAIATCGGDPNDESDMLEPEAIEQVASALTAQECAAAANNGKVTICHKTGSTTNPYAKIKISQAGCKGHVKHSGDIVASGGTCPNQCLPLAQQCHPTQGPRCCNGICFCIDPTNLATCVCQ